MIGYIPPSRHRIHPFILHRPERVDEAAGLLTDLGDGALAMAGGVDVVNWLKAGTRITDLVDLHGIDALRGISEHGGAVRVGALVTHREFERSRAVDSAARGLVETWSRLGNVRIRTAGTVVGNLVAAAAHYDAPPILLALGAEAVLADGTRVTVEELPARPAALVTAIDLPVRPGQHVAYNRDLKPAITVAVALHRVGDGLAARIAVGCALPAAAAATVDLGGAAEAEEVSAVAEQATRAALESMPTFDTDHRASAGYRLRTAHVLATRELRRLAGAIATAR